ncbi:DUF3040 domain-containing protein [Streptomyces sp. NPDC058385]|uniref:DUF3040 domain-containing protein n=1 Tax=Streptomyces sp. NPDC058385 TaxID=3346473 RepID=UPI003650EF82
MSRPREESRGEIEARLQRETPRLARAFGAGRRCHPRANRRAWLLLAVALALLGTGIALAHGLLIAAGLVLAGAAGELLDPKRDVRRHRTPPAR